MKKKQNIYSYVFGKGIAFHFCGDPLLPTLLEELHLAATEELPENSIRIKCSRAGRALKAHKWNFYKGIPWKAAVKYNNSGRIEEILFHAIFFRQFLFFRIVLLPLLWRLACSEGGFYTLGSVYRNSEETNLLLARPGHGKTRCVLQKLLDPANSLVADGALLYIPEYGFMSVVDEIELRWKTVSGSSYYRKLSAARRCKLLFMQFISLMTGRYISFNLPLQSKELGIKLVKDQVDVKHNILVVDQGRVVSSAAEEVQRSMMDYLVDYHNHYKNIFGDCPPLRQTEKNLADFFSKYKD